MRTCEIGVLEKLDFQGEEAINSIATNLSFVGRNMKRIVLTSCTENEGKSSTTMHIMANLARRNKKVLLVDCDLRKSVLLSHFNIKIHDQNMVGLVHFLNGYNTLDEVVYQTNIQGAYLLPAGSMLANPMPILDSEDFAVLLQQLSKAFDVVLLDAPPIGMVIDAAVIAKACDGVIMVVEYGKRRKGELVDAVNKIHQSGCPVIGCIINRVPVRTRSEKKYYKNHYYSYSHYSKNGSGYGYGYGKDKPEDGTPSE